MLAQRLHAIAFGGVVASGDKGHAGFRSDMRARLRRLAGQVGIHPQRHGVGQHARRTAGAPGHLADQLVRRAQGQRRAAQLALHLVSPVGQAHRLGQFAAPQQVLLAALAQRGDAQHARQRGVIAQRRVGVQRQVIGDQVDVVRQQLRQAGFFHAQHARVFVFPEVTVVHQNGVGLQGNRRVDQRRAGGDASNDAADVRAPFHLQAIRAVILEPPGLQHAVQSLKHIAALHRTNSLNFKQGGLSHGLSLSPK